MLSLAPLLLLALPFVSSHPVETHPTFRLRPDPLNAPDIPGLEFLPASITYQKSNPGPNLHAFYDSEKKTVNSTTSDGILWLRPTHGTPQYYVFLGNPFSDPTPALTLWNHWSIVSKTRVENGKEVKRDWLSGANIIACPSAGSDYVTIYSGGNSPSGWGCSEPFSLEVVWDHHHSTTTPPTTTTTTTPPTTTTTTPPTTTTTTTPPVTTTTTCDSTTTTPPPTTTITTCNSTTTTTEPSTTIHPTTTIPGTISGQPTPTPNTTTTVTKPTLKPTETPTEFDGAASPNAKVGSLVVAVAIAVAFFGL